MVVVGVLPRPWAGWGDCGTGEASLKLTRGIPAGAKSTGGTDRPAPSPAPPATVPAEPGREPDRDSDRGATPLALESPQTTPAPSQAHKN